VLLHDLPGLSRGVYELDDGRPTWKACEVGTVNIDEWCTLLADPYRARSVQGLLVISSDIRASLAEHGQTALQMSLIEAGATLQRLRTAAHALSLAVRQVPDYRAQGLAGLCKLESERVLCCASFEPSQQHARAGEISERRHLNFRWIGANPVGGLHVARAEVEQEGEDSAAGPGWGRATTALRACSMAVAEAVERYSFRKLGELIQARACELHDYVDPRSLACYSASQHDDPDLAVRAFDPQREYLWATATDWSNGRPTRVPAEFIYAPAAMPSPFNISPLTRVTSSGCASDADEATAIRRAAYEVIERDALARHWLTQTPGPLLLLESCPRELVDLVAQFIARGCRVGIQILEQGLGPAVIVSIQSTALAFTATGMAVGDDLLSTALHAFAEATTLAELRLDGVRASRITAASVRTPKDHSNLYSQRRHFRRADLFLKNQMSETFEALLARWPSSLTARLTLSDRTRPMYWVDLTANDAPLGFDNRPIKTVRALIPGCLPLAFGRDAIPRGGFRNVGPGGRFPHPFA
jgi:ribosomal protein S12 methylthiotransferase accessory factor